MKPGAMPASASSRGVSLRLLIVAVAAAALAGYFIGAYRPKTDQASAITPALME